jgi:hypothetical protein
LAEFSASEAAFTGFRVVRERPAAAAIWAAIQFAISIGFGVVITLTCGDAVSHLIQMDITGDLARADPARMLALLEQLTPLLGVASLFSLVFYPVLYAAMNRAVLSPGDHRFGYLRLGRDEFRQLLLMLAYLLLFLAAYFAAILVAALGSVAIDLVVGAASKELAATATALVLAMLIVAAACGLVYCAVRLSLASPLTFATRRVDLFGSWIMTRGRFWPMLGAYVLALLSGILVWMLVFALTNATGAAVGGPDWDKALMSTDLSSMQAYFSPARFAYLALSAVSSALVWPLLLTPAVTIYSRLARAHGHPAGAGGTVGDVFA